MAAGARDPGDATLNRFPVHRYRHAGAIDGVALAKLVQRRYPAIKVILVSGLSTTPQLMLDTPVPFMQSPMIWRIFSSICGCHRKCAAKHAGGAQTLPAATQSIGHAGMKYEEEHVDVGGFRLRSVVIAGQDPKVTVVFIHGASCSLLDPLFTFRALCPPEMEMIFVDRPGHGQSEFGPASMLLPDAQADALALLMQQRGIEQAIMVGHSYGGAVAAAFAVRHPQRVSGLLFVACSLSVGWRNFLV